MIASEMNSAMGRDETTQNDFCTFKVRWAVVLECPCELLCPLKTKQASCRQCIVREANRMKY